MAGEIKKKYQFGNFTFDIENLRLEHAGETVRLPPKSLKALSALLEERGKVVSRESLLEKVWTESFVEDANLTVAVSTLRKTLSSYNGGEKFIETVPCRGYRFVGDAREKIETAEQPIVIERRAVEEITIERASRRKRFSKILIAAGALSLLVAVFGFAALMNNRSLASNQTNLIMNGAFLKGDALLQKRQACESIPYFREAVSKDEKFARGYSSLAAALAMCDFTGEADETIAKALALDPNSAEANATDGFIKMFRHWDWQGAESALRRAVALDPNSARARHWLGVYLSIRGRLPEAVGEMARAVEIEPDSPLYHADLGQIYYFETRYAAAVAECRKALELDPNFVFAPRCLRNVYLMGGDEQRAWEFETKDLSNAGLEPEAIKQNEDVFKRGGFKELLENKIRFYLEQKKQGRVNPQNQTDVAFTLAENYAQLGDRANALRWLEQAAGGEKGTYPFAMAYLGVEPRFAFLRGETRFRAVLQKMNLAD